METMARKIGLFAMLGIALLLFAGTASASVNPRVQLMNYSLSEVPALPGCFSEADTLREAHGEARESIEAFLGAGVAVGTRQRRATR